MPMNAVVLGAQVVADLGVSDPVASGLLIAMQAPICVWTASNMKVSPTANIPLIAAGTAITGEGGFTYSDVPSLTNAIASAIGMTDAVGLSKMSIVTQHYADTIRDHGIVLATSLVAFVGTPPPPTGPVSGTGKILLMEDFKFYEALNITDDAGIETWTKYGASLKTHLEAFADVLPGTMMNPATGGPVTGEGQLA
jgi:hypothetical protein